MKRLLVACEFSGIVRDAFAARGWDAWSCDIIPTERPGQHIVNDVRNVLDWDWNMMIAHPPCTHLARSGQPSWYRKQAEQREAIAFVDELWNAPIPRIAIENPRGILSYKRPFQDYIGEGYVWRMWNQLIQPWQFGAPEKKATCLWLKAIPPLLYTLIATSRDNYAGYFVKPGPERQSFRSRTFAGIARAMADQWGCL